MASDDLYEASDLDEGPKRGPNYAPSPNTSSLAVNRANQMRVQALLRQLLLPPALVSDPNSRRSQDNSPAADAGGCGGPSDHPKSDHHQHQHHNNDNDNQPNRDGDRRRIEVMRVLRKTLRELDYQLSWLTQVDLLETMERILKDDCQSARPQSVYDWRLANDCLQLLIESWPRFLHDIDRQTLEQIVPSVVQMLGHERSEVRRASLLFLNLLVNNNNNNNSNNRRPRRGRHGEQHKPPRASDSRSHSHFGLILRLFIDYGLANCRNEQAQRGAILSLPLLMNESTIEGEDLLPLIRCLSELLVGSSEHLFYSLYLALQRLHLMLGDDQFNGYLRQCQPEAAILYRQAASRNNSLASTAGSHGRCEQPGAQPRRRSSVKQAPAAAAANLDQSSSLGAHAGAGAAGGDSSASMAASAEQQKQVTFEGDQRPTAGRCKRRDTDGAGEQRAATPTQPQVHPMSASASSEDDDDDDESTQIQIQQRQQQQHDSLNSSPSMSLTGQEDLEDINDDDDDDDQSLVDANNQAAAAAGATGGYEPALEFESSVDSASQQSAKSLLFGGGDGDGYFEPHEPSGVDHHPYVTSVKRQSSVSSTCSSDAHLVDPRHYMSSAALYGKPLKDYERIHHIDHSNVSSLAINSMGPVCNTPTMEFGGPVGFGGQGELKFGIFQRHLVLAALGSPSYLSRLEAMQEMMCIIRESPINHLAILMTYFDEFLEQFLAKLMHQGQDYKLELIAIDMIETIVIKTKVSTMRYIRPMVGLLVKTLADSRSAIFRDNTIRVLHKMMACLPPQHVIDAIFEHKHSRSPLVREESINRVTAAVLEYAKSEFNLTKLCYHVLPMLADQHSSVRLASLECIATLAQALGPERIGSLLTAAEAVQTGCDYDGLLDAINARLMRHQLPRCNQDGSIRYVIKPFLSATAAGQHQEQRAADVRWVLEAPSSHQQPGMTPYYHPHQQHQSGHEAHDQQHQQHQQHRQHHRLGVYSPPDWQQQQRQHRRRSSLGAPLASQLIELAHVSSGGGADCASGGGGGGDGHLDEDPSRHAHHHPLHKQHASTTALRRESRPTGGGGGGDDDHKEEEEEAAERPAPNATGARKKSADSRMERAKKQAGSRRGSSVRQVDTVAGAGTGAGAEGPPRQEKRPSGAGDEPRSGAQPEAASVGVGVGQSGDKRQSRDRGSLKQGVEESQEMAAMQLRGRRSNSQDSLSSTDTNKVLFQFYLEKFRQSLAGDSSGGGGGGQTATTPAVLPSDSIIYTDIGQAYELTRHQSRQQQTSFDYEPHESVGRIPTTTTTTTSNQGPGHDDRRDTNSGGSAASSPSESLQTIMEASTTSKPASRSQVSPQQEPQQQPTTTASQSRRQSMHSNQSTTTNNNNIRQPDGRRPSTPGQDQHRPTAPSPPRQQQQPQPQAIITQQPLQQPQQQSERRKSLARTRSHSSSVEPPIETELGDNDDQEQASGSQRRRPNLVRQGASESQATTTTTTNKMRVASQSSEEPKLEPAGGKLPSSRQGSTASGSLHSGLSDEPADKTATGPATTAAAASSDSATSRQHDDDDDGDRDQHEQQQQRRRHRSGGRRRSSSRRRRGQSIEAATTGAGQQADELQRRQADRDADRELRRRASRSQPPPPPSHGRQSVSTTANRGRPTPSDHQVAGQGQRHTNVDTASPSAREKTTQPAEGQHSRRAVSVSPSLASSVNIRHILENVAEVEGPFADAPLALKVAMDALESPCWSTKVEGLLALIRLVTYHGDLVGSGHNLHEIVCRTVDETRNLRSTVARSAIFALGDYCAKLKRLVEPELDIMVQALLMKSSENTAFIRDDIRRALGQLVDNMTHWRLANSLINHGANHKSMHVRRMASQFVAQLVERMGAAKCLVGARDISAQVIPAAAKFAQDSSPHTRYFGRQILFRLMQHGAFERLMRRNLTPNLYRSCVGIIESVRRRGPGEPPAEN